MRHPDSFDERNVSGGKRGLRGLRVFVVEDEIAVLLMVEDMLTTLGCKVVASESHLSSALKAAQAGEFDAAVLDINVAGEPVYPVAEALAARNVPIVFSTGYSVSGVEAVWRSCPIVQKPYRMEQLGGALKLAMGGTAN